MPNLLLRKAAVVAAYPDEYSVILVMEDGFELAVGSIQKEVGADQRAFWQWSSPGHTGRAASREEAMAELRAAWDASDEDLTGIRRQQEWTANKYALWDAGFRGKHQIQCKCGVTFNSAVHHETMAHIEHITGRRAGT